MMLYTLGIDADGTFGPPTTRPTGGTFPLTIGTDRSLVGHCSFAWGSRDRGPALSAILRTARDRVPMPLPWHSGNAVTPGDLEEPDGSTRGYWDDPRKAVAWMETQHINGALDGYDLWFWSTDRVVKVEVPTRDRTDLLDHGFALHHRATKTRPDESTDVQEAVARYVSPNNGFYDVVDVLAVRSGRSPSTDGPTGEVVVRIPTPMPFHTNDHFQRWINEDEVFGVMTASHSFAVSSRVRLFTGRSVPYDWNRLF